MSLLWTQAVRMQKMPHEDLIRHVSNWPDKVHVTQAGFHGHVQSPVLDHFLKFNRTNQDAAWYHHEDIDLHKPIYSWQPHVLKEHVLKYLNNPDADTEKMVRDREKAKAANPKSTWDGYDGYAGDDYPTVVRWQGRHIVTDGSHRMAAEMLRGTTPHVRAWVYDADKHGFRANILGDKPDDYPKPKPIEHHDLNDLLGGTHWWHHDPKSTPEYDPKDSWNDEDDLFPEHHQEHLDWKDPRHPNHDIDDFIGRYFK